MDEKTRAQLTLPGVPSLFAFSFSVLLPKLRSRCLHAATGLPVVPWHGEVHRLQPLHPRAPVRPYGCSCARYPISGRYFYSQILRSLVACLVMSVYTRSVNTRPHNRGWRRACTCRRACVRARSTYRDTRGTKRRCTVWGWRSVCDRVLYTCHRTDRWTPCRFHFHPRHGGPSWLAGRSGGGRVHYFFPVFFSARPFLQTVRVSRCGFFCPAFASRALYVSLCSLRPIRSLTHCLSLNIPFRAFFAPFSFALLLHDIVLVFFVACSPSIGNDRSSRICPGNAVYLISTDYGERVNCKLRSMDKLFVKNSSIDVMYRFGMSYTYQFIRTCK